MELYKKWLIHSSRPSLWPESEPRRRRGDGSWVLDPKGGSCTSNFRFGFVRNSCPLLVVGAIEQLRMQTPSHIRQPGHRS